MNVTFTRTAERRYRVSVDGPGVVAAFMEPAPGYDPRLPHDMAHFVVERELGIDGGVFGQLAAGGHANTFRPAGERPRTRVARRGERLAASSREDAELSERLVHIACRIWNNGSPTAIPPAGVEGVSADALRRVCRAFDEASAAWSTLAVGESMTLAWESGRGQGARHRSRHGRS
jgi:hypothetical protein